MTITQQDIEEQIRKDREAVAAMDPRERERLQRIVDVIRTPSGVNFTDPEAL
jgi:hypothetical protein